MLVTGGGSGINLAFVKLAAQQGARVIIADLKLSKDAEDFITAQNSKNITFQKCDVTKRADLVNLVSTSLELYKDVPDVYIAGAGVFEPVMSYF